MSFMRFWGMAEKSDCAGKYARVHERSHALVPPLQGSVIQPLNLYIKLVLFVLRLLPWWQPHRIIMGLQF